MGAREENFWFNLGGLGAFPDFLSYATMLIILNDSTKTRIMLESHINQSRGEGGGRRKEAHPPLLYFFALQCVYDVWIFLLGRAGRRKPIQYIQKMESQMGIRNWEYKKMMIYTYVLYMTK